MDILKNRQSRDYDYTSRYVSFSTYYNTEDDKYMYGITKQLGKNTSYVLHTLREFDTADSLALKYYGRPDYFWIILDFNKIQDPYIKLSDKYTSIKIPSLSNIYYDNGR